jgi:DNA-binding response OmpR family regulator
MGDAGGLGREVRAELHRVARPLVTNSPRDPNRTGTASSQESDCLRGCMPTPLEHVLIASGDPDTRSRVRESLETLPVGVQETASGRDCLARVREQAPDLVIADMLLEDLTGLALCRALHEDPALEHLPLLLVSAYTDERDRILAFEIGVDDFVPKPFFKRELASRVGAILRRSRTRARKPAPGPDTVQRPLHLDPERGRLEVHGRPTELTPKEFEILAALLRNEGRVLSRERIVNEVWGGRAADPRVVDAHVKSIRRKLGDVAGALQTIRGVGFRFSPREPGPAVADDAKDPEAA